MKTQATINGNQYPAPKRELTGADIKRLAGIDLGDVLFRQRDDEDEVITNDACVRLRECDILYSSPPACYGDETNVGVTPTRSLEQPDGWTFAVFDEFHLPPKFAPRRVNLLVKLPPGFPDAAPDMFWLSPPVNVSGHAPRATTVEQLLGQSWMRFSWHLRPGGWRPGVSTLADFIRVIRARLQAGN